MHFWFFLLLILSSLNCFGQIFTNKNGEQLSESLVFNTDFIRENNIKSINGRYTMKKAGKPMIETNYWHIYEFDSLGRISRSYETRKDDGTLDTIWTNYFYNDKGLPIYKSEGSHTFYKYTSTVFDSLKRVVSIEDFTRSPDLYGTPITREMNKFRFTYEVIDGRLVKTKMNKQGTPYAKITYFVNDEDRLTKEEDRYISTNEGMFTFYEYDKNGNLTQRKVVTSKQEIEKEISTFKYDAKGNLMEKKDFSEGKLKKEIQFLYNEISNLPSAILYQEGGSSNITILRIKEYEYF